MMIKGGEKPLYHPLLRGLLIGVITVPLLIACSNKSNTSTTFSASGYITNKGIVRVWRKDEQAKISHLRTIFTPFSGENNQITDYFWQNDKLIVILRRTNGSNTPTITLHFGQNGDLSFMQQQNGSQRQMVSNEKITELKFYAAHIYKLSKTLINGKIVLKQGRWNEDKVINLCDGTIEKIMFDNEQWREIEEKQKKSKTTINLAWLEAGKDKQLILITSENICQDTPTIDDL